jgi:2-succinyl-5-enolpyruvyl-6-hydroxy-3-cyclohexene-1-carboxylate synthase
MDAPNTTYLWTQCLVEELVRCGVDTFFVAPGSRSTPLTVAAARHEEAEVVLHVDERGTAFAALGYGRATGRPAGWITTSGTAVANGMPAVVEAGTDGVPMLLLTADRPPELRDTGANQTVDQVKLFGDYVRWQADVPPPSGDVDPAYVLTTADQAVHRAVRAPRGPVHLNCMFRKPLEPVATGETPDLPDAVQAWAEGDAPFTTYPTPTPRPSAPDLQAVAAEVAAAPRGLVVAGRLDSDAAADAVRRLAARLGWPLLPDVTSRLRLGPVPDVERIAYADAALAAPALQDAARPEAVLQVGGRFASKRLRLFLRDAAPPTWAVVRPDPARIDPDHRVTHHVESSVAAFAAGLLDALPDAGDPDPASSDRDAYRTTWREADRRAARVLHDFTAEGELSEPLTARLITRHLPPDHALVTASSMPVRDVDRYAVDDGEAVPVFANRGASGIDGTVATTAGVAAGRGSPATLFIGDLALWHDLNSLALLADRPDGEPVVVVVVNNDGGGIFHKLPIREHEDVFEPYFTTPHGRTFEDAAATFGLAYDQPATPSAFTDAYRSACTRATPTLIEVRTDREAATALRDEIDREIADAIGKGGKVQGEK